MKRSLSVFAALSFATGIAFAQAPLDPGAGGPMPPGHPPVGADDAPAEPGEAPAAPMPPGHPPTTAGQRGAGTAARTDTSTPSKDLPPGTIDAQINDAEGKPLPGVSVRLGILRQSVAEGDSSEFKNAVTNADGKVRFDRLELGSRFSYRITVKQEPAEYASASINLREDSGQSVVLHVYPVTSDIRRTMVGMRGFVMVEPRDDVFQFEVLLRVFNVGATTWVPEDVVIELPRGWKGFSAQEGMGDTRAVAEGERGAKLLGTFSPGQHEVAFRFQVPNDHDETVDLKLGLPPHIAELQVMAESARGMGFEVSGMPPAQPSVREDGRRMLTTGRQLKPGEPEMEDVSLRLTGIPTPGPGRWYAAGIAAALAALGLMLTAQNGKEKPSLKSLPEKDITRARNLLLDELVALEQAHRNKDIGPRTYESARRALVNALARLEVDRPTPTGRVSKKRARAH